MCSKETTVIYPSTACFLHLKKNNKKRMLAIHLHLNFSSNNMTRIQLNESPQFAKKAAEVNKPHRDVDKNALRIGSVIKRGGNQALRA